MSSFQRSLFTSKLPPKSSFQQSQTRNRIGGKMELTPVCWSKYFTHKKEVLVEGNSFRVYTLGEVGPTLLFLHGGGFSALTWALLAKMMEEMVECRMVAVDLRGHGDTITSSDDDLSITTLASDVVAVVRELPVGEEGLVLVGHSLGGAVAVHAARLLTADTPPPPLPTPPAHLPSPHLLGLVVIDVVEGTALGALASMQSILRSRPHSFNTIEDAIKWSLQSGQLKNFDSARVSMPGQIKNCCSGKTATCEVEDYTPHGASQTPLHTIETIPEADGLLLPPPRPTGEYTWRIDLRRTESHWQGWFEGLSKLFLCLPCQKLLLLASLDRLDTDLTVAHMQGKFEVHAFEQSRGRCGHIVHEDIPDAVAQVISTYLVRNRFAKPKQSFSSPMPCC